VNKSGVCVQKIELCLRCENTHKTTVVTADTATIELLSRTGCIRSSNSSYNTSSAAEGSCLRWRLYIELSISPKPNSIWGFASITCFWVKNATQWLAGFVGCTFLALFYYSTRLISTVMSVCCECVLCKINPVLSVWPVTVHHNLVGSKQQQ